jgi:ribosomal protein S18 acetylase RimI-like enzyme
MAGKVLDILNRMIRRRGMRKSVRSSDVQSVKRIVRSTRFFSEAEVEMAGELVETYLKEGRKSGYRFVFLEEGIRVIGYACYGEIPCTKHRYDLYWIAVDPQRQGKGYGRKLLELVEEEVEKLGGQKIYIETSSRRLYAPTRQFYRDRGYLEEARLSDFYSWGDHKVIFSKILEGAVRTEDVPKVQIRATRIRRIQFRAQGGV